MQRLALAGATGLFAAIGGYTACPSGPECTLEARPSLTVKVVEKVDGRYVPARADSVHFVVDPHPSEEGPRIAPGEDAECTNDDCSEWTAGVELAGEFSVDAIVCGKRFSDVALVEMEDDGCHVKTGELLLEVDRSHCDGPQITPVPGEPACSLELRPSAVVRTFRKEGDRIVPTTPSKLVYWPAEAPRKPTPLDCADASCTIQYGPWEQAGAFVYEATYCGQTMQQKVQVEQGEDGCHVETEAIKFTFDDFSAECETATPPPPDRPLPVGGDDFTLPPEPPPPMNLDGSCIAESQRDPAFVTFFMKRVDDHMVPIRATDVTFQVEDYPGTTYKPWCLDPERCSAWVGPNRGANEYLVKGEVCGIEAHGAFEVVAEDDGCGLTTAFRMIVVDTRGCLTAEPPPIGDPIPFGG